MTPGAVRQTAPARNAEKKVVRKACAAELATQRAAELAGLSCRMARIRPNSLKSSAWKWLCHKAPAEGWAVSGACRRN